MACCLEVLGWLAARHARFDRAEGQALLRNFIAR